MHTSLDRTAFPLRTVFAWTQLKGITTTSPTSPSSDIFSTYFSCLQKVAPSPVPTSSPINLPPQLDCLSSTPTPHLLDAVQTLPPLYRDTKNCVEPAACATCHKGALGLPPYTLDNMMATELQIIPGWHLFFHNFNQKPRSRTTPSPSKNMVLMIKYMIVGLSSTLATWKPWYLQNNDSFSSNNCKL